MKYIILLLSLIFLFNVNCQPASITTSFLILDHYPDINSNFEPVNYNYVLVKSLLKSNLNSTTLIPELNSLLINDTINQRASILRPDLFKYFFNPMNGQNKAIPYSLTLNINSNGYYIYNNPSFYPIDYNGYDAITSFNKFKDNTGKVHNYHYCLSSNLNFKYIKGNETFAIKADNDVWVYINNILVIDNGGFSNNTLGYVSLNQLNLKLNNEYKTNIFMCQRNTFKSSLYIETNIELYCSYYDICGVCNGNGKSCLNKCNKCSSGICSAKNSTDCAYEIDGNNIDLCSEYYCDQVQGCYKKPKCQNPYINKCQISTCKVNNGKGECYISLKPEIDDNNICTHDDCDPRTGLITHFKSNKCNNII